MYIYGILRTKRLGQRSKLTNCACDNHTALPQITLVGVCKTQDRLQSIGISNSPNSIALQADYVTVVEDHGRPQDFFSRGRALFFLKKLTTF